MKVLKNLSIPPSPIDQNKIALNEPYTETLYKRIQNDQKLSHEGYPFYAYQMTKRDPLGNIVEALSGMRIQGQPGETRELFDRSGWTDIKRTKAQSFTATKVYYLSNKEFPNSKIDALEKNNPKGTLLGAIESNQSYDGMYVYVLHQLGVFITEKIDDS